MPSLNRPNSREQFTSRIEVIENGSGFFRGILDEPPQGSVASYQFTEPRRLLRVPLKHVLPVGCVIKSQSGGVFIVAELGSSEDVFKSYRLFDTTGQYQWERRQKGVDPVTNLENDSVNRTDLGLIWGTFEPQPEQFDRQIRSSFEIARFITNKPIKRDDIVNGHRVTRVDQLLGVYVASLG